MAAATDELMLLERVFLRIGAAESDEQLQNALSKFLPPVLLKLSSPQDGVRKKVMELLVHVNKRVKSRPTVQLPVESLLVQYQDPSASSFVTNFTVIYIRLGFPRLSLEKQAELVPSVLSALNNKPVSHQDSLFLAILPALGHVKVPTDSTKCSVMFGFPEKPQLAKQFADFLLDVLLAPYGWTSASAALPTTPPNSASSLPGDAPTPEEAPINTVPPGMSEYAYRRVCGETPMKAEELEQAKVGIIKFLSAGVLPEPDVLCHFVVASADSRFSVVNAAETELRKVMKGLDWTNAAMMAPLFSLYLGSQQLHSASGKGAAVKPELRRAPAGTRLRLKLLPCLTKAREAALPFPLCIQVFFDSLYSKNTNFRLKTMALQFCLSIIEHVNPTLLSHVAGVLLTGLVKLFTDGDPGLKGQVYAVIGQLAVRFPSLVNQDLHLLTTFMTALGQEEGKDLRLFIREALLKMVEAFRPEVIAKSNEHPARIGTNPPLPPHVLRAQMLDLLSNQFETEDSMLRYVVIRYIEGAFGSTHAPSRYLLLMASADNNKEVSGAALKALGLEDKFDIAKQPPPQFPEMVQHLWDKKQKTSGNKSQGANQSAFSPQVFVQVIKYLRVCLAHSAGVVDMRESLNLPNENTPKIGRYLRQLHGSKPSTLDSYLSLVHQLLVANPGPEPLAAVVEAVGSVPDLLAKNFLEKLVVFKNLLNNTNKKTREIAAEVYGILLAHCLEKPDFEGKVKALTMSAANSRAHLEEQLGCCLSSAYAVERYIRKERASGSENREQLMAWANYQSALRAIATCINSTVPALMETACESFGLLARCGPLALPVDPVPDKDDPSLKGVLKKLQEILKDAKMPGNVKETVGKAAGYMFVGDKMPFVREALEGFIAIGKATREVDIHMELGDVIVNCILGPASPAARDLWTTEESEFKPPPFEEHPADSPDARWFYDLLINELSKEASPAVKQMTCFWLVALLKNCSASEELKKRLSAIQKALTNFLGEPSEIVQDVTSTGLALVHDLAGPEEKKQILEDLMTTFSSGQRGVRTVTSDTKVFEEGELGKAPGGGQISTYGDICKLASHLNKPDLVYSFMNLSKHNTVWSSKKGAAFSISVLATKMGEEMKPYLGEIIPLLYRYRFDPNPRTQTAMSSIWHRLVPETSKAVDQYHKQIMQDLVTNLVAYEYRVRHSCCAALEDFVRGGPQRTILDSVEFIPELWANLFRVMDDSHERTRQAAFKAAYILRAACVRACDSEKGKDGQAMVQALLPIMLEKGITHTVTEVRLVSVHTVSQLVNVAGAQLKPHLAVLLPALLESKGDMDRLTHPLSRTGNDGNDSESAMRWSLKTSSTMDPITKCVQYIDADVLESLVPRLADMIKHCVHLETAMAVAKLLTMLAFPLRKELQPHAGKLLGALMHRLTDRNGALRSCYASAVADIVGSAKESSLERLFAKLREWYCTKEEEHVQSAVCQTLRAISRQNNEMIKNYGDILLPVIFFAMHQKKTPETKNTIEMWEEVWSDSTSSYEGTFKLHGPAIISLLSDMLQSSSWTMKAQAADSVSTLANRVGEHLDKDQRETIINILLNGLSGRTWEGKQCLLQALATMCSKCRDGLRSPECAPVVEAIISTLLRESKKDQLEYKAVALATLGSALNDLQVDRFKEVYELVTAILNKAAEREKGRDADADQEENSLQRNQWLRLQVVAYDTLGKAWPLRPETQMEYQQEVVERLESCLTNSTRGVQEAVVRALACLVDKMYILRPDTASEEILPVFEKICPVIERILLHALDITKNSLIRKESLSIVLQLAKKMKECGYTKQLQTYISSLSPKIDELLSDPTPEVRTRVVDIREFFSQSRTNRME